MRSRVAGVLRERCPGIHKIVRFLVDWLAMVVKTFRLRPHYREEHDRFYYQGRYNAFDIKPEETVVDIGSGHYPFPRANVLVDLYTGDNPHRSEPLVRDGRTLVVADVQCLPFPDKAFDFVYCSHVLEHVEDPIKACREIMRIGKRGYIETPTFGKDTLFAWAKNMHRWHVVAIAQNLCFFEYSQEQEEGIGSSAWRDLIFGKCYHPMQRAFFENQDIFNVMFNWSGQFSVFVFRLDGTVKARNMTDEMAGKAGEDTTSAAPKVG
jgi:SAM-dependent methyltransferase